MLANLICSSFAMVFSVVIMKLYRSTTPVPGLLIKVCYKHVSRLINVPMTDIALLIDN